VYKQKLDGKQQEDLVYIDETGIDSCNRRYAKSKKGTPAIGAVSGNNHRKYTVLGAYNKGKVIAPLVFNGSTDTEWFIKWTKEMLLPCLKKGQTVVMDNASFHKSPKIRELIESVGCELLYLPPYSPDLNPIEKVWAILKKRIQSFRNNIENLYDNLCEILRRFTTSLRF